MKDLRLAEVMQVPRTRRQTQSAQESASMEAARMMHQATKVRGGCLCGAVRYEAEVFLHNGYICHCTICQRSTGQPAEITVLIKASYARKLVTV